MSKSDLRLDWATHAAAKYACQNWHYSHSLPCADLAKIGVWEREEFKGVVIFSRGATPEIGRPYGLQQNEICELTRIALRDHTSQVSRITAISIKFLIRHCPGIRLVVSFADTAMGHHGGIYQAAGWIYAGHSDKCRYRVLGIVEHPKTLHSRYGKGGQSVPWLRKNVDPAAECFMPGIKHRYLMPLDDAMRVQVVPLSKPYPKRAKQATAGDHPTGGGAAPTRALQPTQPSTA